MYIDFCINILYFTWLHDEILVILLELLCELNCCQIKKEIYMCTIYTRLNTCLIIIHRFALRDKVTLLALYFHIADAAEWLRVLDIRLSDRYRCVSKVWVLIPSWVEQKICQLKNIIQALCKAWLKYIYIPNDHSLLWRLPVNITLDLPELNLRFLLWQNLQ